MSENRTMEENIAEKVVEIVAENAVKPNELEEKIDTIRFLYAMVCRKDQIESEFETLFHKHISNDEKQETFNKLYEQLRTIINEIQITIIHRR